MASVARTPDVRLIVFVATRIEEVPPGLTRYASVDGSVPGAVVCWDHHQTGEAINLDAMPARIDLSVLDGIGTTSADADAAASAVACLFGGSDGVPAGYKKVLESASYWCDLLNGHPMHDAESNRLGRGLSTALATAFSAAPRGRISSVFATEVRSLAEAIAAGMPLPYLDTWIESESRARDLDEAGVIQRRGDVAIVDLRGREPIDPRAVYARHRCAVSVTVGEHPDGGPRYTVGVNPNVPDRPEDVRPALAALAAREFALGPPCDGPRALPGDNNWGGRALVGGSPWNYGSRLKPEEVAIITAEALGLRAR